MRNVTPRVTAAVIAVCCVSSSVTPASATSPMTARHEQKASEGFLRDNVEALKLWSVPAVDAVRNVSETLNTYHARRVNGCQVATGAVGLAHGALWGFALGGPAGAAAGAGVGAFWWAVGTQC